MMDILPARFIWPTVNTNFICRRCLIWEWSFYAIHSHWHWYQLGERIIQSDGITGNVCDLSAPGWYTVQWCVHTFFLIVLPSNVLEYHTYLTVVNGFSFTLLYKGIFTKWILQVDKNAGWHFFVWHPVSSAVCKWVISEEEPLKYVRIHHPNICQDDDDVMEMGEK